MRLEQGRLIAGLILTGLLSSGQALANSDVKDGHLMMPYVAVGGKMTGWHFFTGLSIRNPRSSPQSVAVEILDNEWETLPVILNGESELTGKRSWTIPPDESREFVLSRPGEDLQGGWIRVSSAEESAIEVRVVVRFYNGDALILESGVAAAFLKQTPSSYRNVRLPQPLPAWHNPQNLRNRMRRS